MLKIQLPPCQKLSIERNHWEYFENTHFDSLKKVVNGTSEYKDIFEWILDESNDYKRIKNIIMGSPSILRSIISEARNRYPKIYSEDFYFKEKERLKEQGECFPLRSKMRKATVNKFKDETIGFIDMFPEFERFKSIFITKPNQTNIKKALKSIENERKRLKKELNQKETKLKSYQDNFNKEFFKIFDYEKFSKQKTGWSAYELVFKLNLTTCPYCNRAFTSILKTETGKTRPSLDHFYPKSIYPFLALSLYNLIPCCHVCNSSFKKDDDFYINEHIHPYENGFEENGKFSIDLIADKDGNYSLTQIAGEDAKNRFDIKLAINKDASDTIKTQIDNSNCIFR